MRHQPTIEGVNNQYGAPFGRSTWLDKPTARCHLFRLALVDGAYDSGGAYWGAGQPIWCCTDAENFRYFVRANNRKEAFDLVKKEFPHHDIRLKRGIC